MKQEIVKVGNVKDLARELHSNPSEFGLRIVERVVKQMANDYIGDSQIMGTSFLAIPTPYADENCISWHVDGGWESMVISAYPTPTEIFIPNGDIEDFSRISGVYACLLDGKQKESFVEKMVSDGLGETVTPDVGDVYVLKNHVLHRTHPKAIGEKHLVLRTWFGREKDQNSYRVYNERFTL